MSEKSKVRALGEVALRVTDLDRMQEFYENVVGLDLMRRFPRAACFKIADGFAGHTQVLALEFRTEAPKMADASFQGFEAAAVWVRREEVGRDARIETPFGRRLICYADLTATSGDPALDRLVWFRYVHADTPPAQEARK